MAGSYVIALLFILYPTTLNSGGKEYKYKGTPQWSWQQKQYKKTTKKIYVTCRLKTQKTYKGRLVVFMKVLTKHTNWNLQILLLVVLVSTNACTIQTQKNQVLMMF